MLADTTISVDELLDKAAHTVDVDFLPEGVRIFGQQLMEAEVAEHTAADRREYAPERRSAQRNG